MIRRRNSDRRQRELQRRLAEAGDPEVMAELVRAQRRAGVVPLTPPGLRLPAPPNYANRMRMLAEFLEGQAWGVVDNWHDQSWELGLFNAEAGEPGLYATAIEMRLETFQDDGEIYIAWGDYCAMEFGAGWAWPDQPTHRELVYASQWIVYGSERFGRFERKQAMRRMWGFLSDEAKAQAGRTILWPMWAEPEWLLRVATRLAHEPVPYPNGEHVRAVYVNMARDAVAWDAATGTFGWFGFTVPQRAARMREWLEARDLIGPR